MPFSWVVVLIYNAPWLHLALPGFWLRAVVLRLLVQGYGVYVFGSGQRYEGHWDKGKKHGWSIYTVETGAHIFWRTDTVSMGSWFTTSLC